ncbi:GNAT family N-acetyltransferase [Streptomyces sp. NPDC059070]|uniref:GNAT family N-acetyltransferase n=1 Tax=Streptomyces sp. NPDC059070 TaxID=3346713 RepID=UPI0036859999
MNEDQQPRVRRARPDDLPRLAELAAEHAVYEKAAPPAPDFAERLGALLFGPAAPRVRCLVAEIAGGEVVGYASCAPEFATWQAREYLHMDCLFLRDGHRGLGLGERLMAAVVAEARELGLSEVQWQTPVWNEGARRFYDRVGAAGHEKVRYSLEVAPSTEG